MFTHFFALKLQAALAFTHAAPRGEMIDDDDSNVRWEKRRTSRNLPIRKIIFSFALLIILKTAKKKRCAVAGSENSNRGGKRRRPSDERLKANIPEGSMTPESVRSSSSSSPHSQRKRRKKKVARLLPIALTYAQKGGPHTRKTAEPSRMFFQFP